MTKYLPKIIPVIIVTILLAGGVELFYRTVFTKDMATNPESKVQKATSDMAATITDGEDQQPDYQVILKRNLFGPPPKENNADETGRISADKPAATSLELALLGTITGPPQNRRAILLDKKTKVQNIYSQGDVIDGALLKEIQREKIILLVNGKDEILVPEPPTTSPTPPTDPDLLSREPPETAQEPPPEIPSTDIIEPEPIEFNTVDPNQTLENRLP